MAQSKIFSICVFIALSLSAASQSRADLSVNGFGSFYGQYNLLNDHRPVSQPHDGMDFNSGSRLGLNLRSEISPEWSVSAQALAAGTNNGFSGGSKNWDLRLDWAFVTYQPSDALSIKAGRQMMPIWLASDYKDVGLAYVWPRPPYNVYILFPFKAFEGLTASYEWYSDKSTTTARLFGGSGHPNDASESIQLELDNLVGAQLAWKNDGLRGQITYLTYKSTATIDGGYTGTTNGSVVTITPVSVKYVAPNYQIAAGSFQYDRGGMFAATEVGLGWAPNSTETKRQSNFLQESAVGYLSLGYHFGNWLPLYTVSNAKLRIGVAEGDNLMHAIGLNYRLNPSVVLKSEFQLLNEQGHIYLTEPGSTQMALFGVDFVF